MDVNLWAGSGSGFALSKALFGACPTLGGRCDCLPFNRQAKSWPQVRAGVLHPAIRACQQHRGLSLSTCRPQRPSWKGLGKPGSEIGKGCAHFTERKGEGQGPNPALLILTGCSL